MNDNSTCPLPTAPGTSQFSQHLHQRRLVAIDGEQANTILTGAWVYMLSHKAGLSLIIAQKGAG